MPRYIITEKAGLFVAGHRNTGTGTVLDLLPHAAAYELTLGTLVPHDPEPPPVHAAADEFGPELPDNDEVLPDNDEVLPDNDEVLPDNAPEKPEVPPPAGKRKRPI